MGSARPPNEMEIRGFQLNSEAANGGRSLFVRFIRGGNEQQQHLRGTYY